MPLFKKKSAPDAELPKQTQPTKPSAKQTTDKRIKNDKATKVALQNLLFGTNEKKLMVSDEFLNDMALRYISKRMRAINQNYENIHNTKSAESFFKYVDETEKYLDDLIKIEPYYIFKNPVPSIYKVSFEEQLPENTTEMIKHSWKNILIKFPMQDPIPNANMEKYDAVINELLSFKDRLTDEQLSLINEYYVEIHGQPEEPEEIETEDEETENIQEADESETYDLNNDISESSDE